VNAYRAEQDLILADQFRDGNVPAGMELLGILQQAIPVLPSSVRRIRLRSYFAAYVHALMDWCREEIQGRARVEFGISADVNEELRATIRALPEEAWKPLWKINDQGWVVGRKEWAEVEFVPTKSSREKRMKPDRYLAIRVRPAQGEFFADGNAYRYFAVVTNRWSWERERLLPQKVCSFPKHQALVAYDITGEADKNWREDSQFFAVHLFPNGGSHRAEGIACVHTEPDRKPKT
jgi:hypothetical protein